ncbi:hypothetical protein BGW39_000057 [Mortierella sp. 14UC]|nr:hypothetical protein BGW39_000057 [Mortierella sp. 14UC]
MLDPPRLHADILHNIAQYLDAPSYLACTTVSSMWREVYIPYLWRTVDLSKNPFNRIFAPRTTEEEDRIDIGSPGRRQRVRKVFRMFGKYIRALTVLLAALEDGGLVTGLRSLTMMRELREEGKEAGEGFEREVKLWNNKSNNSNNNNNTNATGINGDGRDRSVLITRPWEDSIPKELFTRTDHAGSTARTRATWLLIHSNPSLQNLAFDESWTTAYFKTVDVHIAGRLAKDLDPVVKTFLNTTFKERIPSIQHLQMELGVNNLVFDHLGLVLPNLQSFAHSGTDYFNPDGVLPSNGPPRLGWKRLELNGNATLKLFRALPAAFPNLTHLTVHRVVVCPEDFDEQEATFDKAVAARVPAAEYLDLEVLEWSSLESLTLSRPGGMFSLDFNSYAPDSDVGELCRFLDSQIRFPKVMRLDGRLDILSPQQFQQALEVFPAVQELSCFTRQPGVVEFADGDEVHPIRTLVLLRAGFPSLGMDAVFARMPFLVDVEVQGHNFDRATLLAFVRMYRKLERFCFDLVNDGGRSRAMADFMKECPATLKICRGKSHVVQAVDLVVSAEWPCTGLEELDIDFVGVPRLDGQQEWQLDKLMNEIKAGNAELDVLLQDDDGVEKIRGRLQQLKQRDLTSDDVEALEQRQISSSVQKHLYRRLGRLTQLRKLGFGTQVYTEFRRRADRRLDTLDFSMAAGLAELGGLVRLQELWFHEHSRLVAKSAVKWMKRRWAMVEVQDFGIGLCLERKGSKVRVDN